MKRGQLYKKLKEKYSREVMYAKPKLGKSLKFWEWRDLV